MAPLYTQRMTAELEDEFVVFLIGMRVNQWWNVRAWLPPFLAMPRMIRELSANPELGFLGSQGILPVMVQYWRSFDQLEAYARGREHVHLPAWAAFNRQVRTSNGAVGIWHETYRISPGAYENVYVNMPAYGLGRAGALTPVGAGREHAREQIGTQKSAK